MRAVMVGLVVFVWVFLWGELSWANVLAGVVLGVVLTALVPGPAPGAFTIRPIRAVLFAFEFAWRLAVSSVAVAVKVLTPGSRVREGILRIEVRPVSPEVQIVVAGSISLTPGTFVTEITERPDATVFYVHVLDLDDVEAMRRDLNGYANRAVAAFAARPREAR
jgi:multicomponent Na+:H+ antiporter subunit E